LSGANLKTNCNWLIASSSSAADSMNCRVMLISNYFPSPQS
jgi:hypothetical protein